MYPNSNFPNLEHSYGIEIMYIILTHILYRLI